MCGSDMEKVSEAMSTSVIGCHWFQLEQLAPRLASWTSSHGLRTFGIRNESKYEISMVSARTGVFLACVLHVIFVSFFIILKRLVGKNAFRNFRPQFRTKLSPSGKIFRNIPTATPCGLWTWGCRLLFEKHLVRWSRCILIALPCGEGTWNCWKAASHGEVPHVGG